MSKATVRVLAQYFENYSESGTFWKAKGSQEFILKIDSDTLMYLGSHVVVAIKQILAKHSNSHCKYEYVEHQVNFSDPIIIEDAEIEAELEKLFA